MSPSSARNLQGTREATLSRKDWLVLPAVGVLAIVLLGICSELIAKWALPASSQGLSDCFAKDDPTGNATAKPNSVCSEQIAESPYIAEYRFDRYGHRAGMQLLSKAPDTYRIVMIGSSFAMGLFVPREMTFAALLPAELSKLTSRKIELYNEATGGKYRGGPFPTPGPPIQFNEALSADPDMILWIVTSNDFVTASPDIPAPQVASEVVHESDNQSTAASSFWSRSNLLAESEVLTDKIRNRFDQTRVALLLKHLMLESETQDQYVTSYLKNEDDAGFLRSEPGEKWQRLRQQFEMDAAEYERQAKAAGVPLVVVFVPNRAQAAMISMGRWPTGYDPYELDKELRKIIESNGGTYIDVLDDYRTVPDPEQNYFPVDGHPNSNGHAMITRFLTRELTSGAVPALRVTSSQQMTMAQER